MVKHPCLLIWRDWPLRYTGFVLAVCPVLCRDTHSLSFLTDSMTLHVLLKTDEICTVFVAHWTDERHSLPNCVLLLPVVKVESSCLEHTETLLALVAELTCNTRRWVCCFGSLEVAQIKRKPCSMDTPNIPTENFGET